MGNCNKKCTKLGRGATFLSKHHKSKRFLGFIPACDTDNHEIINAIFQYLQLPN